MQTLIITRVVFSLLALPVGIIAGTMFALALTFYAFSVSPPLALIPLGFIVLVIMAFARWERGRIARGALPPDEER